jgi:hypothetical protein
MKRPTAYAMRDFRCRNLRPAHVLVPLGPRVACQAPAVGVWDITEGDDPRRIPLCADCAGPERLARTEDPIVTADEIMALVDSGTCWCSLARTGLRVCWCPATGLTEEFLP